MCFRVEDLDDILPLLDQQNMKSASETSAFLLDLIKNQNHHSAVCEVCFHVLTLCSSEPGPCCPQVHGLIRCCPPQMDGAVVGFVSAHRDIDVGTLQNHCDLSEFDDFYKVDQQKNLQSETQSGPEGPEDNQNQFPSQEVQDLQGTLRSDQMRLSNSSLCCRSRGFVVFQVEVTSNAFCIQLLRMKKKYETRYGSSN